MAGRGMKALDHAVATRIRELAARLNVRQAHIADAAGIPRETFGRYWNAERPMSIGDLEDILAVLGTSYADEAAEVRRLAS